MEAGKAIAHCAQLACILEVCAPKPGNVNRNHDFVDTTLEDFLISALAIGPAFEKAAGASIGQTIWTAAASTRQCVRTNTNLGMILLLAPLAKTCSILGGRGELQDADSGKIHGCLQATLNALTVEDARYTYAAIRMAQPGGLGQVSQADVAEEPTVTLFQAMELAQNRDAIAHEYVTGYSITFEIGWPALNEALAGGAGLAGAIVQAFLTVLSRVPDTLIARKRGLETARQISRKAEKVLGRGGIFTSRGQEGIDEMDRELRDRAHTLNPGTTADLTAAAIFLLLVKKRNPEVGEVE
jgi:triphosphoribosyl-dephospho-CoA synthase